MINLTGWQDVDHRIRPPLPRAHPLTCALRTGDLILSFQHCELARDLENLLLSQDMGTSTSRPADTGNCVSRRAHASSRLAVRRPVRLDKAQASA